jgi:hypothetical protein
MGTSSSGARPETEVGIEYHDGGYVSGGPDAFVSCDRRASSVHVAERFVTLEIKDSHVEDGCI